MNDVAALSVAGNVSVANPIVAPPTSGIRRALTTLLVALLAGSSTACGADSPIHLPLTSEGNLQLPAEVGTKPTFAMLTFDPRRHLLYVAHTSNSTLDVVDGRTRRVIASIPELVGIKQVALTPDPNQVLVTERTEMNVALVDTMAMKVLGNIPLIGSPGAIESDPVRNVAVVASGGANELDFIDQPTQMVTGTATLPGTPELLTLDSKTGRVYVAISDRNEVAVVDLGTQKVTAEYRGCDIKAPIGMAFDPDEGRLFVASRGLISVIDVLIDKCLGSVDIGSGVEQIAINPHKHHLYTANGGSRNLSVIDTVSLQPLGVVGTGPSGDGVAVDPTTDTVYVIVGRAGIISIYHDP